MKFLHTLYNIVDECVPKRISSRRHKIQKTHCPKHKYPKAVHKVLTKKPFLEAIQSKS